MAGDTRIAAGGVRHHRRVLLRERGRGEAGPGAEPGLNLTPPLLSGAAGESYPFMQPPPRAGECPRTNSPWVLATPTLDYEPGHTSPAADRADVPVPAGPPQPAVVTVGVKDAAGTARTADQPITPVLRMSSRRSARGGCSAVPDSPSGSITGVRVGRCLGVVGTHRVRAAAAGLPNRRSRASSRSTSSTELPISPKMS